MILVDTKRAHGYSQDISLPIAVRNSDSLSGPD
jgi:hypothetical protein